MKNGIITNMPFLEKPHRFSLPQVGHFYFYPMPKKKKSKQRKEYEDYINSPEWQQKRKEFIATTDGSCEKCGKINRIMHVHHLTYANFGNEKMEDLQLLCVPCHNKIHGRKPKKRKKRGRPRTQNINRILLENNDFAIKIYELFDRNEIKRAADLLKKARGGKKKFKSVKRARKYVTKYLKIDIEPAIKPQVKFENVVIRRRGAEETRIRL